MKLITTQLKNKLPKKHVLLGHKSINPLNIKELKKYAMVLEKDADKSRSLKNKCYNKRKSVPG